MSNTCLGHGQNHCLNELLYLLVESSNIAVALRRFIVDLMNADDELESKCEMLKISQRVMVKMAVQNTFVKIFRLHIPPWP